MPVDEERARTCYLRTERKADCRGCEACASACPVGAIAMAEDSEGFRYPVVNKDACVSCGRCYAACELPESRFHAAEEQRGFGGSITDEAVLADSTSGGAFTAIASAFLAGGGSAVFGVEAKEVFKARHACSEDSEGLAAFRGSKYVQSEVGGAYSDVRDRLMAGERVLFSGTPCQVAGLYGYLRKLAASPLLLTLEVVCEGVPAPALIEKQLAYVSEKRLGGQPVAAMRYRDKWNRGSSKWAFEGMSLAVAGWDFESSSWTGDAGRRHVVDRWFNPFWSVWLQHLISRPSCAECPFARRERVADVTLGDLWGVHLYCPDLYNDDRGASVVVCNTKKGLDAFEEARPAMACRKLDMADVVRYQGPMRGPAGADPRRGECMADLSSMGYREFTRKWAKRPTLKLLVSKYLWGTNRQVCARENRKSGKGKKN